MWRRAGVSVHIKADVYRNDTRSKASGTVTSPLSAGKTAFERYRSPECCDIYYTFCLFPFTLPPCKDPGCACQHTVTYFLSSSKFCSFLYEGWGGRQFICHGSQKRRLTLPAPPPLFHYTDSSLISHQGTRPPHEFGPCSPPGPGPGPACFYNSANDAKIFLSLINLINILIMTWR